MEYKDYYATLGVSKDSSKDEIQKAYRRLARKYHPDVNKNPEAEDKFKEITEAYEVLKDPEKRQKYDQFGSAWKQAQRTGAPPPGYEDLFVNFGFGPEGGFRGGRRVEFDFGGGASPFSSFFEMLFGGDAARGGRRAGTGRWAAGPQGFQERAGADHEARLALPLEEAARGGRREITLTSESGQQRTLAVNIPKGVKPGQKLRLAGQGGEGGSGKRGDLYLTVDLLPHPRFRLADTDLYTTLPVAPWEAALGGTAVLPTLDGEVTVRIPAGSSSGRTIRLRGKGFPSPNGPGDLFAEIRIVVPPESSSRERELWEELEKASEFRPRRGG